MCCRPFVFLRSFLLIFTDSAFFLVFFCFIMDNDYVAPAPSSVEDASGSVKAPMTEDDEVAHIPAQVGLGDQVEDDSLGFFLFPYHIDTLVPGDINDSRTHPPWALSYYACLSAAFERIPTSICWKGRMNTLTS
jgi:hypothetical protein